MLRQGLYTLLPERRRIVDIKLSMLKITNDDLQKNTFEAMDGDGDGDGDFIMTHLASYLWLPPWGRFLKYGVLLNKLTCKEVRENPVLCQEVL